MNAAFRYQIAPRYIDKMRGNVEIESSLMLYFGKSAKTIRAWINENDIRLTVPGCLDLLADKLKVDKSEITIKSLGHAV